MFSAKTYSLASAAVAAAMLVLWTSPGYSATNDGIVLAQQADPADAGPQPSAGEDAAPAPAPESGNADEGQSSPPAGGTGDAAAPAQDNEAPPTPSDAGPEPSHDNGSAATGDGSPPAPEGSPAEVTPDASSGGQSSAIDASQLKIGQAVLGSDGAKIGEVNGVKSDTQGKVQEILVTAGTAAGINAQVFAVSGDKITEAGDSVKLSLTSEEAKQLPIIDNSSH